MLRSLCASSPAVGFRHAVDRSRARVKRLVWSPLPNKRFAWTLENSRLQIHCRSSVSEAYTEGLISSENVSQADSIGTWLADLYDSIDYVEALNRAEAAPVDFDASATDFIYGEFDSAFFLGLLDRLNPGDDATFADIGSGRGQLVILAALVRKWRRCTGVEIVPILHELACAALELVKKEKDSNEIRYP